MEKAQRKFCFFLPIVYTNPIELENNLLWLAASFIKKLSLNNLICSNFPLKLCYRDPSDSNSIFLSWASPIFINKKLLDQLLLQQIHNLKRC